MSEPDQDQPDLRWAVRWRQRARRFSDDQPTRWTVPFKMLFSDKGDAELWVTRLKERPFIAEIELIELPPDVQ